jgi:hypothetical protein
MRGVPQKQTCDGVIGFEVVVNDSRFLEDFAQELGRRVFSLWRGEN